MSMPDKSKDQMKSELLAALKENPGMTIRQMMSYGLAESTCYQLRRQVRAVDASAKAVKKTKKSTVDAVVSDLKNTSDTVEKISKRHGIGSDRLRDIAKIHGIDLKSRRNRKARRPSKGSGNGHKPYALESMSGDMMSLTWLTYSWGCTPQPNPYYFGV